MKMQERNLCADPGMNRLTFGDFFGYLIRRLSLPRRRW